MTSTAVQYDAIWLRPADYAVAPLNAKLKNKVTELSKALEKGLPAYPDNNRQDFYDVELENGWAYIHIREDRRMVYLIAYSKN